jgi:elongation of very long chain fatty acids protein 4
MNTPLNTPTVKAIAQKVVNILDFVPDTFLVDLGPIVHKYCGGSLFYDPFEKVLVTLAPQFIAESRKYYADNTHPLLKGFVFTDPVQIAFWLVFYLVAICVIGFVGKYVAYPGRLEVKNFSLVHNTVLCLMSAWMGALVTANALSEPDFTVIDLPITKRLSFAKICWIFATISKVQEFVDTFIMMLKQNYRQVSFLHVYHHLSILVFSIHFCIFTPGGDCWVSVAMNCLVHTFMYFYYAATVFAGKTGPLRNFLDSIKFIITKGQMTQFGINFIHGAYMVFVLGEKSRFPYLQMRWMMAYMTTMLVLFGKFLIDGQREAARAKKLAKQQQESASVPTATGGETKKTK